MTFANGLLRNMNTLSGSLTMALTLSDSLRKAIEKAGYTNYALAQLSGVNQSVLSRFLSGERDINLETAGKITAAIGLELKPKTAKK